MNTTTLDARTVSIVRELTRESRTGANGQFEAVSILFKIAVDRDYKSTHTVNGKTITEVQTDFWLAKAMGKTAENFAKYCTSKKEDGKLISRRLLLNGNFENYDTIRKENVTFENVTVEGLDEPITVQGVKEFKQTSTIFIVNEFRFLDRNPDMKATDNNATAAPTVSVNKASARTAPTVIAAPAPIDKVAQSVQAAPQSVQAQPAQVVQTQPIQAQPAQTQPAQTQPDQTAPQNSQNNMNAIMSKILEMMARTQSNNTPAVANAPTLPATPAPTVANAPTVTVTPTTPAPAVVSNPAPQANTQDFQQILQSMEEMKINDFDGTLPF